MNGYLLLEYVDYLEAPLRERALRDAAQRELALQAHHQSLGSAIRLALGEAMVGIGNAVKGKPAQSPGDSANAAT